LNMATSKNWNTCGPQNRLRQPVAGHGVGSNRASAPARRSFSSASSSSGSPLSKIFSQFQLDNALRRGANRKKHGDDAEKVQK
jgi:hypothetical protein